MSFDDSRAIGWTLTENGVISKKQYTLLISKVQEEGGLIETYTADLGFASLDDIIRSVVEHYGVAFIDLKNVDPDTDAKIIQQLKEYFDDDAIMRWVVAPAEAIRRFLEKHHSKDD